MYQIEVKRSLVAHRIRPADGWAVTVDIDAMERCRGGSHPADKLERVRQAETDLIAFGARIGAHPKYG